MLGTNLSRRSRFSGGSMSAAATTGNSATYLARPRLPLRSYLKPKSTTNLLNFDQTGYGRSRRFKPRKLNGFQKIDTTKKKPTDYTEMAYREAVSKLKYLLAESYTPRILPRKFGRSRDNYQDSNPRINESEEDTDDRSVLSNSSRTKEFNGNLPPRASPYLPQPKNIHLAKACSNLVLSAGDQQGAPPELASFIERQEEYIEQLERESQYCRDELTNLLGKVREVVAENDALHDKNKNGFLKSVLDEYRNSEEENKDPEEYKSHGNTLDSKGKRVKLQKVLEGPSIMFESRISELEAQLTQAKVELRKAQEENQSNIKRLAESGATPGSSEMKSQLEQALRDKREIEGKLEDLQRSLILAREKESDTAQKAKRALDIVEQAQFEKTQAEAEIRRLRDELDRQHEKLREAAQEANRRVADERHQVERRYSQQVEQLSADIASHWDAASKSQLESEKQRRELADLRRDLAQKQALIDDLKKELQNKISSLQSDLSQAVAEKDAAEQEVSAATLSAERSERQARHDQSRLQAEINSYKQRLERADADLVHCRRENLRLSEQIASLEKEIGMNKMIHSEAVPLTGGSSARPENEKELTSMIMNMESKHAATVATLEDAMANQASLVSQLTAECQSLTHRLEANSQRHKEEMDSLQTNIMYLSSKIQDKLNNDKGVSEKLGQEAQMYNKGIANLSERTSEPQEVQSIISKKDPTKEDAQRFNERLKNPENEQYTVSRNQEELDSENDVQSGHVQQEQCESENQQQELSSDVLENVNQEGYDSQNVMQYDQQEDQNLDPAYNEQMYQYDQYDPSQYEGQQYVEDDQYKAEVGYQDGQYNEQEYQNYPNNYVEKQSTELRETEQSSEEPALAEAPTTN
ncbi:serologically defined colon cancer antigen 8 homolog [Cephus cinctus]|uniref:Serologically defined colon cancer antigen 8 homolog n=1 Tax=Cephus cinctus TaxID=211228 RepID=A0AAJ7BH05_CEPCN|nr:serologically defined colon cancer antigen 8 homolog [Cephus cinctus]